MATPIDFYFDFSSPYGYFAAELIEGLAVKHGREVHWHPVLLGVIFKATGAIPLLLVPLKGDYAKHDLKRFARLHDLPFAMPSNFPIAGQHASRAVLHVQQQDPQLATQLAQALYRAFFVNDQNIGESEVVLQVAHALGLNTEDLAAGMHSEAVKNMLRDETAAAQARGVFGSPFVIVDDEPFWGVDHLPMLDEWLKRGGF